MPDATLCPELSYAVHFHAFGPRSSGNAKNLNTWYSDTQTRFIGWVRDHYFSHDPAFKKQWYEVQKAAGTDALVGSMILPDTYYGPLGWVDYGKGV